MAESCVPVRVQRLCCPLCSQFLRNPVTVPCGHNFCLYCIQDRWDRDNSIQDRWDRDNSIGCPECGCIFPSRPELIINLTLAEMVSDAETSGSGSKRRTQQDAGASKKRKKQEQLKNMQMKSKQILQQQEKECESIKTMLSEVKEEARRAEDRCEIVVSGVVDSLQRHYLSAKGLIAAQEQKATAKLQSRLHTLQERLQQAKSRDAELAQTECDVGFLQEWPSHLAPLCHSEAFEDPLLPLKTTKTVIEQIGRQVEELCDKEFTSLLQTADGGEQQGSEEEDAQKGRQANSSQSSGFSGVARVQNGADVEPTTRSQFLQYARELTLDPFTAHKDLVVSAGDKKVKLSPQTDKAPSVRSSERFLKRRQVLCREGLWAERCYYEVEVVGGKVEIALAYKGIDRKSLTLSSAFGGNANSWSLDRSTIYSVNHNTDGVELIRAPHHRRIGVYLSFKEGTLAFYEVSDVFEMIYLYKDKYQFKEPLYPGFWLEEKCCIRICDLKQGE
ncbi:tripartite motif-containing protein 16-like isoform X2 [Betta splendens]|uniref:Tripartite motif-containing protein 16-like isoform X2 n=1 Tax=Betta splendens TaxID=158456 RepID=A0A6P7ML31_BETSP|nr:tripartite motif-containing protein 16-like isoform X2 [Betta splendens]